MGFDYRNHRFAPGSSPGWVATLRPKMVTWGYSVIRSRINFIPGAATKLPCSTFDRGKTEKDKSIDIYMYIYI